uniref:DUF4007 family protein n=1 Tax=uncultured Draconibacterium sp. TaxID=1573823 RepID=UPI0032167521
MKLELTNGYRLHFEEFSRILSYLKEQKGRNIIPRQEIVESIGMSVRQYESLSSIMVALDLIKPSTFVPTEFGSSVANNDLFFEKEETLWIMHYNASCNPKWVIWHRLVNQIFQNHRNIDTQVCLPYFQDLSQTYSEISLKRKVPKEIQAVLYIYAETHFLKLNYLSKIKTGVYKTQIPNEVTPLSFLYMILHFLELTNDPSTAIGIKTITEDENSPGKVLNIDSSLVSILFEKLSSTRLVNLETFGDLYQLRLTQGLNKQKVLTQIYS